MTVYRFPLYDLNIKVIIQAGCLKLYLTWRYIFLADAVNSSSELPAAAARVQRVSRQAALSRILAVVFVFYCYEIVRDCVGPLMNMDKNMYLVGNIRQHDRARQVFYSKKKKKKRQNQSQFLISVAPFCFNRFKWIPLVLFLPSETILKNRDKYLSPVPLRTWSGLRILPWFWTQINT